MPIRSENLQQTLEEQQKLLESLPATYTQAKRATDRAIDALCVEAGIFGRVQDLRDALEKKQRSIQSQADNISGRILILRSLLTQVLAEEAAEAEVEEEGVDEEEVDWGEDAEDPDEMEEDDEMFVASPTHRYGLELARFDEITQIRLLHGKITDEGWHEMVTVLGGDPNRPDWDGSPDVEDFEEESDALEYEESVDDPNTDSPVEELSNDEKRRLIRAQIRQGEWSLVDSLSMEEGEESVPDEENFDEP